MAYSEAARERRRCTGTRKDGQPCEAWAVWGDERQLCVNHGRPGPRGRYRQHRQSVPTRYQPCTCAAYAWPHRPGGGLCRWPELPTYQLTTPAGTHSWPRVRDAGERALIRMIERRRRR